MSRLILLRGSSLRALMGIDGLCNVCQGWIESACTKGKVCLSNTHQAVILAHSAPPHTQSPHLLKQPHHHPRTPLPPGNLLLNRSLLCKVGDVGLSRLMPGVSRGFTAGGSPLAGGAPMSTVMDSRLVGTPCYMDPEYLRTGRFGPKSDVYSLGESQHNTLGSLVWP